MLDGAQKIERTLRIRLLTLSVNYSVLDSVNSARGDKVWDEIFEL